MKNYLLVAALLNMSTLASAATLEGTYDCSGTDDEHPGVVFKGVMVIKKTGQTYAINSSYSDGVSSIGTGIYDQAKHNLSFIFANPKNANETGLAIMDVKRDYTMTSNWTYLNQTTIGHSVCSKHVL